MQKKTMVFFDFVTHFGGSQRCTALLCKALKQHYCINVIDAYGCCEEYLKALSESGVPTKVLLTGARNTVIGHSGKPLRRLLSFSKQLPAFLALRQRLISTLKEIKPDLVWTNSPKALFFLSSTGPSGKPFALVYYAHGWYRRELVSPVARLLIKKNVDGILAVSNPTARAIESWGVSPKKVSVVYNTIDFARILDEGKTGLSKPVPHSNRKFKIAIPAALLRTKGQHTAIKAAEILQKENLDFSMYLAGDEGSNKNGTYGNYLRHLIHEKEVEERVFLLGWRTDVRALINFCDAFVLPTHTEGLPMSVVESMILRRPVITTPVGGIPDLIVDGQTGLLFPVEDEKALASCLQRIARDRDLGLSLTESAYRRICDVFHPDKHIPLVIEAFEKAIANKKAKE